MMMRLKRCRTALLAIGIVLLWSTGALAAKCFLRYDDGTVVETWAAIKDGAEPSSSDRGRVVTLDVWQEIEDLATWEPVSEVYPGQDLILWCYFNALGELAVPFDQLVGRDMLFSYILIGALDLRDSRTLRIEAGDEGWFGTGIPYTVPTDAPAGKFLYFTRAEISGLWARNSWDWGIYTVVR
jgi:hypothetical protein